MPSPVLVGECRCDKMQLPVASTLLVQALAPQAAVPATDQLHVQGREVDGVAREHLLALLDDIRGVDTEGLLRPLDGVEWGAEVAASVGWAHSFPTARHPA